MNRPDAVPWDFNNANRSILSHNDERVTADALARDVERFLSGEPVEARPPDPIYRLGKFARRHRRAILASGVFLLFLTVATTVSLWLAVRAKQAEKLAETRLGMAVEERNAKDNALQDAEAVSRLTTDFFQRPLPSMDGRTATVADALDLAVRNLDEDLLIPPPRRAAKCPHGLLQGIQREIVHPLPEGEARVFRYVRRPV